MTADSLLETEKPLYKIQIGLAHFALFGHDTLAFFGFLGKNVAFERFLEGDLTRAGHFKPLFCTRIGSNLWHLSCFFYSPTGGSAVAERLWSHLGLQS